MNDQPDAHRPGRTAARWLVVALVLALALVGFSTSLAKSAELRASSGADELSAAALVAAKAVLPQQIEPRASPSPSPSGDTPGPKADAGTLPEPAIDPAPRTAEGLLALARQRPQSRSRGTGPRAPPSR